MYWDKMWAIDDPELNEQESKQETMPGFRKKPKKEKKPKGTITLPAPPVVIGIDQSETSTGFHIEAPDGTVLNSGTFKPPTGPENEHQRDKEIVSFIQDTIKSIYGSSILVVIEDTVNTSFSVRALAGLSKLVRFKLWLLGVPYFEVVGSTLKKYATGSGAAKKNTIMMEVLDRFKFKSSCDDHADAYVLCRIGRAAASLEEPTINAQRDVLKSLPQVMIVSTQKV